MVIISLKPSGVTGMLVQGVVYPIGVEPLESAWRPMRVGDQDSWIVTSRDIQAHLVLHRTAELLAIRRSTA
jgi:hypothetical protein